MPRPSPRWERVTDSSPPVGFLLHPEAPLHDTGWGHPEHQGRLRALSSAVGRDLLARHPHVVQVEPGQVSEEDLLRVHTPEHIAALREKLADTSARFDEVVEERVQQLLSDTK